VTRNPELNSVNHQTNEYIHYTDPKIRNNELSAIVVLRVISSALLTNFTTISPNTCASGGEIIVAKLRHDEVTC
jgi:hypothetical protein